MASEKIAQAFIEHRERLMTLVRKNLNPILLKRMSYEDVLQSAYEAAAKRLDYFDSVPDVPIYFKLRTILLQTIANLSRRHLQSEGRDVYKEVNVRGEGEEDGRPGVVIENLAADETSPVSRVDRDERHALLRRAVAALGEADRQIIVMFRKGVTHDRRSGTPGWIASSRGGTRCAGWRVKRAFSGRSSRSGRD